MQHDMTLDHNRENAQRARTASRRRVLAGIGATAAVVIGGWAGLELTGSANAQDGTPSATPPGSATPSPVASPSPVAAGPTIDLIDISFNPKALTIPAGINVVITLTNKGAAVHNFNIDDLNIHSGDIQPGNTTTVTINAKAGSYQYYCNIPGHKEAGMVGTLTVK